MFTIVKSHAVRAADNINLNIVQKVIRRHCQIDKSQTRSRIHDFLTSLELLAKYKCTLLQAALNYF